MKRKEFIQALTDHAYENNDEDEGLSFKDTMDRYFNHFEAMSNEELINEWLNVWGEVKTIEED